MARAILIPLALISALVLGPAVAARDETIPTECPKTDEGNTTVNLAHETDCTKYYGCSASKKYLKECPKMDAAGNRLHFNPILQVCDWPENVHCELPEPRAAVRPQAQIPTKCPKVESMNETVHLAHETDCTKFYTCAHGKKVEMDCPPMNAEGDKLHFNAALQVCDWPDQANCKVNFPCIGTCPDGDYDHAATLPHKEDCAKYCLCHKQDNPSVENCRPAEYHFSVVHGVCVPPSESECK